MPEAAIITDKRDTAATCPCGPAAEQRDTATPQLTGGTRTGRLPTCRAGDGTHAQAPPHLLIPAPGRNVGRLTLSRAPDPC